MGWHLCEFCLDESTGQNTFENTSSGDIKLIFSNGHKWVMPDMVLHYIVDHKWLPPQGFIDDVMNEELASSGRSQTRGMSICEVLHGGRVGYLTNSFEKGPVPEGFIERLEQFVREAGGLKNRVRDKKLPIYR